jgi:hypothetical protein
MESKSFINNDLRYASNMAYRVPIERSGNVAASINESHMKKDRKETGSSEPIGIIISRGDRTEPTPVFSAYICGPVPDAVVETATSAA